MLRLAIEPHLDTMETNRAVGGAQHLGMTLAKISPWPLRCGAVELPVLVAGISGTHHEVGLAWRQSRRTPVDSLEASFPIENCVIIHHETILSNLFIFVNSVDLHSRKGPASSYGTPPADAGTAPWERRLGELLSRMRAYPGDDEPRQALRFATRLPVIRLGGARSPFR